MQQQNSQSVSASDLHFGDFGEEREVYKLAANQQQQQQNIQKQQHGMSSSPVHNKSNTTHSTQLSSNKSAGHQKHKHAGAAAGGSSSDAVDCSRPTGGGHARSSRNNSAGSMLHKVNTTPLKHAHHNAHQSQKSIKYTLEELKSYSKSAESRKPPMVKCHKGDCISQLFVPWQQHHHTMTLHHMQQQYQQMNFNESIEFVTGKRRGGNQHKKHHDHQSGGGGSNAGSNSAGDKNSMGTSGVSTAGGSQSQNQRKMEIIRVHLSLKEDIKLAECENAWQPETLRSKSSNTSPSGGGNDDMETVLKKVRGVLNKLTPDNFDVLLKTMTSISMNTQEKMQQVSLKYSVI